MGNWAVSVQYDKAYGSVLDTIAAHGRDSHLSLGETRGAEYMEKDFYFILLSLHIRPNTAFFLAEWCYFSPLSLSLDKSGSVRKAQLPQEATKGFRVSLEVSESLSIAVVSFHLILFFFF